MHFEHIGSSFSKSSHVQPLHFPFEGFSTQLITILRCLTGLECGACFDTWLTYQAFLPLKKIDCCSSWRYQMPIALQLLMRSRIQYLHSILKFLFDLSLPMFCTCSNNHCKFIRATALLNLENIASPILSTTSGSHNLSVLFSMKIPEPWRNCLCSFWDWQHPQYLILWILTQSFCVNFQLLQEASLRILMHLFNTKETPQIIMRHRLHLCNLSEIDQEENHSLEWRNDHGGRRLAVFS